MKKWDEATALAIAYSNTKRKKREKDLVTVAEAMKYLATLYKSQKKVAEKLDLSSEMVRQFLTVLKLPKSVQKLFECKQIDSVDTAKELSSLGDKKKQETAARTIVHSSSKEVRDIKRLVKRASVTIGKAKQTVFDEMPKGLNVFLLDFDEDTMRKLVKEARASKMKPAELVRTVIVEWLAKKSGNKD
jgi:hypothetical protein